MTTQATIEEKLQKSFELQHLEVINESSMHNVPPGSESHFKLIIVSSDFEGKMLLQRHRETNKVLEKELATSIHALSIHALTPSEWAKKNQQVANSPECRGGSNS